MLDFLQKYEKDEALLILSKYSSFLLPSFPDKNYSDNEKEVYEYLNKEIRASLNISNENTPKSLGKIFKFLTDEMTSYSLRNKNIEEIQERLGKKGILNPELYKITYSESFLPSTKRGIRRNHIIDTISNPSSVQHFKHGIAFPEKESIVSLFVKTHNPTKQNEFFLLVQAERKGTTLLINNSWRIYSSDIKSDRGNSPLDLLKAFVDRYGTKFAVGNSSYKKFFLEETIDPVTAEIGRGIVSIEPSDMENNAHYEGSHVISKSITGVWEVSIAYIINISKYYDDLRKHNVKVEMPKKP